MHGCMLVTVTLVCHFLSSCQVSGIKWPVFLQARSLQTLIDQETTRKPLLLITLEGEPMKGHYALDSSLELADITH